MKVRLFAQARDLARSEFIEVHLGPEARVAELRAALVAACPALAALLARSAIAVAGDFAQDSTPLPADAEVAVLPPVSGG